MTHLAAFLRLLPPLARQPYLPLLKDLTDADEASNWRFRRLLGGWVAKLLNELYCRMVMLPIG